MKNANKTVLIMAGGTGGHVFPALSVAVELKQLGCTVHWLGTMAGIESSLVPKAEIPIHYISIKGIRGKGIAGILAAPFKIIWAIFQALKVLVSIKPFCVIGFGGFASGPGAIAAKLLGLPLFIHEQNAIAGTTNKILSIFAKKIFIAFPHAFPASSAVQYIGNPVRKQIINNVRNAPTEPLHILVLGGSLGAKAINDIMPKMLAQLAIDVAVCHQTGKAQDMEVKAAYAKVGKQNVNVIAFIDDMAAMYAWADVVICRAGAMTVSELTVAGLPAIFIPFPFAIDDHQTTNARWMVDENAAYLLPQKDITVEAICTIIEKLDSHREELEQMKLKSAKLGINDAAIKIAHHCLELCHESK